MPRARFRPRFQISSRFLILSASLYFGLALNCALWRYVLNKLPFSSFSECSLAIVLPLLVCIPLYLAFNLLITPKTAKPLLIALLLISSTTNYLMTNLGVYIDRDMIRNAFETNTREALDLVTWSGCLWVFFTGVLPAVALLFTRVEFDSFKTECKKRLTGMLIALLTVGIIGATSYKTLSAVGRNNKAARKIINTQNYIYSTFRYVQHKINSRHPFVPLDEHAQITPYEDHTKTVLIFVLGETARAANFSLQGYERQTNPLLKKQNIAYFKNVTSCGTATAVSVPCLFSPVPRADFDVDDAPYTENLIDLLQKAGYDILWRDNDDGCKGVCQRVRNEEMKNSRHPKYCFGSYCHDEVLLDGLEDIIKNIKQDTVIFLHTMGSHGPTYFNRYPDKFKKFNPTCDTADMQKCTKEQIVNTYDNTILYTDFIVSSAIDILKKFPQYEAGLIYVSDHGESLGENNIYLHGFPYALAPKEQIEVPMLVWMNGTMKKWDYIDFSCLKKEAEARSFSHDNIFHSLVGLLEIDTKEYDKRLDMFNPCRKKKLPFMERDEK